MIHIETLQKFKECLPDPEKHREKVMKLRREEKEQDAPIEHEREYKEWDTTSKHRSPDFPKFTPIVFRCDFVQNKWQWIYVGEVII